MLVFHAPNGDRTLAVVGDITLCLDCRGKVRYPSDIIEDGGNSIAEEIYINSGGVATTRSLDWIHMTSKEARDWRKAIAAQAIDGETVH